MTAHTLGPWHVSDSIQNGKVYVSHPKREGGIALCQKEQDAARIVACVNACEGMDDPAFWVSQLEVRRKELDALRTERDALRAALQAVLNVDLDMSSLHIRDIVRAALSANEGKAQGGEK